MLAITGIIKVMVNLDINNTHGTGRDSALPRGCFFGARQFILSKFNNSLYSKNIFFKKWWRRRCDSTTSKKHIFTTKCFAHTEKHGHTATARCVEAGPKGLPSLRGEGSPGGPADARQKTKTRFSRYRKTPTSFFDV